MVDPERNAAAARIQGAVGLTGNAPAQLLGQHPVVLDGRSKCCYPVVVPMQTGSQKWPRGGSQRAKNIFLRVCERPRWVRADDPHCRYSASPQKKRSNLPGRVAFPDTASCCVVDDILTRQGWRR